METLQKSERLILRHLDKKGINYWDLIAKTSLPFLDFLQALEDLKNKGYLNNDGSVFTISQDGDLSKCVHKLDHYEDPTCNLCFGRGIDSSKKEYVEFINKVRDIASRRGERMESLDQAFAPPEVIISRVMLMRRNCDIEDKAICILGDDDCMGIALALTALPSRVTILEYDKKLIDLYKSLNAPRLELIEHDLKETFPRRLSGQFDTFFTDPTPTLPMMSLFLSRGMQSLKQEKTVSGYFTLSQMEASSIKWYQIQNLILKANFTITDLIKGFNTYELEGDWLMNSDWRVVKQAPVENLVKPQHHWYRSSLVRIESIGKPKPPIKGTLNVGQEIYMDNELLG